MAEKILILGGTREAAELAAKLDGAGHDVTTSLAGRTKEPAPVPGKVHIGGFGGIGGLARYIADNGFTRLIDATHPFATRISANAEAAAILAGIPIETRARPPWKSRPGDEWLDFPSLETARDAVPPCSRVLLAVGSQHVTVFACRTDVHWVVRMVDLPETPLPLPDHELIPGRPGSIENELELMGSRSITHILCRNSGGLGAYAKIEAARQLRIPVLMVSRPV